MSQASAGIELEKNGSGVMKQETETNRPVAPELTGTESMNSKPSAQFAFGQCADRDLRTREFMKRQAVEDGVKYCDQLAEKLHKGIQDVSTGKLKNSFNILGGEELQAWIHDVSEIKKAREDHKILVGVAGATGAGKTSFLNALLKMPELLPSSSSEAATASVCQISWNDDDTPGHEFRAEIVFRPSEDLIKELDEFFEALNQFQEGIEKEFEDDEDQFEAEAEMRKRIQDGLEKLRAVWSLEQQDVENRKMTSRSVLDSNQEIFSLLGTTKVMHSSDQDTFALDVKGYLDSTSTDSTAGIQGGYSAWPLIEEVRLYVKSDVLKHGIVLVDLPGLSDMVDSRAEVAERYYQKLSITMIVAPVIRAADEKTNNTLMSKNQEMRMQLDGNFHKKSYCVVLSKVDEIDCDAFCKANKRARQDTTLCEYNRQIPPLLTESNELEKKLKSKEKDVKKLDRKLTKFIEKIEKLQSLLRRTEQKNKAHVRVKIAKERSAKNDVAKLQRSIKTAMGQINKESAKIDRDMARLGCRKKHRCILMRNDIVKDRITGDFAKRQAKLARGPQDNIYDGSVEVFPVCAAAYRDLQTMKKPMRGFPTEKYTGIPRVCRWLEEITLETKEQHLDSLLHTLQRLFFGIQRWSQDHAKGLIFFRENIQDVLGTSHNKYSKKLQVSFTRSFDEIKKLNPLGEKAPKLAGAKAKSKKVAFRWVLRNSDDLMSTTKMAYMTYHAVLRRNGGPYLTRYGQRYDFPEALGVTLLEELLRDWTRVFDTAIPEAANLLMAHIKGVWTEYGKEIESLISKTAPDILPYLKDTMVAIECIQDEMRDKIRDSLKGLSNSARAVHSDFLAVLRACLRPIFEQSLRIKGKGSFATRQQHVRDRVAAMSSDLFGSGYDAVAAEYAKKLNQLPSSFQGICDFVMHAVQRLIGMLLNNLQAVNVNDADAKQALSKKAKLQQDVKAIFLSWDAQWRVPERDENCARVDVDVDIPREYEDEDGIQEGEVMDETDEGDDSEMDVD